MADQRENEDIQLYEQTEKSEKGMINESSSPIECNADLAVEQPTQPVTEFCHQAFKSESLLPESQVSVVKQTGSQIQQELCVYSPEGTVNEINGNIMSCVILATPDAKSNLDAGKSWEVGASEKCDTLVSSPVVTDNQEMELSVSAQLEILSFERSQIMNQNSEGGPGQQLGHCSDLPQVDTALRDVGAQEEFSEDDDTSSSEDTSSESESDSTSSLSSSLPLTVMSEGEDDEQEPGEKKRPLPVKTKDELLLEDLPNIEEISIVLPEDVQNEPIGIISSIIDQLVIVESLKDIPPVNEETFLFRKNRCSVGQVFEVFGPVCHPFYVVRFNSHEDIAAKGIELHELLYFAPAVKDFTQYIFTEQLKQEKGSDASWRNDQEPPPEALDFSDDEKEKKAKQTKKKKQQQQNPADKNTRTGRKEDGQASQQTQAQSMHGRRFQHGPGHGFGPYSSARFQNTAGCGFAQPWGSFGPPFNQGPPCGPPRFHPTNSQPVASNPMMPCPYSPSFWPPVSNNIPPFLSHPPPPLPPPIPPPPPPPIPPHSMSTGCSESNVRHPPCFPNSPFSCFTNASSLQLPNSQFSPQLPPQSQPDFAFRPPY